MKKVIRIMAIIAAGLTVLSLTMLLFSMLFQRVIARELFSTSEEVIAMLPMFPWVSFFSCLLKAGCIALLIVCCGNKKGGIWMEILVLALLIFVLPAINNIASLAFTTAMGRYGSARIAAYSCASQISAYCLTPSGWGQALAFITCGMSITYKAMCKKLNIEE